MSTMQIVWIIVLAVVIIALIGLVGYVMNKKKMEQNRARAEGLRSEAGSAATVIPEAQVRAREAEARAERARLDAQKAEEDAARANQALSAEQAQYEDRVREADRLDPDVDHRASDYHPDTSTAEVEQPSYDAGGRIETATTKTDSETDKDDPATHPATHTATTSNGRPADRDPGGLPRPTHRRRRAPRFRLPPGHVPGGVEQPSYDASGRIEPDSETDSETDKDDHRHRPPHGYHQPGRSADRDPSGLARPAHRRRHAPRLSPAKPVVSRSVRR